MQYRTKLYLSFLFLACISTSLTVGIIFFETKRQIFNELQSKVESIAITTAIILEEDVVKHLEKQRTPKEIQEFKHRLHSTRSVNRRDDVYVGNVFVLQPYQKKAGFFEVVVDAPEEGKGSQVGAVYPKEEFGPFKRVEKNSEITREGENEKGDWFVGFAPVYDREGKYIATIGIDIFASEKGDIQQLVFYGLYALFASFLVAIFISYILSRFITKNLNQICHVVEEIGKGDLTQSLTIDTNDEFNELADSINRMTRGLKERERLISNFSRYVSKHVLEKILESDFSTNFDGERKKITVLFTDIRHFTCLAEKLPPEEVVSLLNEYFEKMLNVVFRHDGTLDKFIGDGVMVEFGTPLEDAYQEKHAVETALEMQKEVSLLSEKWKKQGRPGIETSMGIHTGEAIVGNIGSEQWVEYTAVGDTVNIASRLEQECKKREIPLLISAVSAMVIEKDFSLKSLGSVTLPGREEVIEIYSVEMK